MNARPPDGSDEPEAVDQVMLAVLSNRGRDATALSAEQERLVDDWVAGRLAPDDAERAATLVRQNALAAERVLERRLQAAASESPPVPAAAHGADPQGECAAEGVSAGRLVALARPLAVDEHRRRGGAGVDPGGRRHAAPAADDERRRAIAGGDGNDQRSRPAVRSVRPAHARNDATARSGDRGTFPRHRNADRPAQGPCCNDRPAQERNVQRDRTPCPRRRRDRRSPCPCDRQLLAEAKNRRRRSRSNACARL